MDHDDAGFPEAGRDYVSFPKTGYDYSGFPEQNRRMLKENSGKNLKSAGIQIQ